jgi:Na+-translocating ferredoxin:NAD+ oxidoreductase subunit C
MLNHGPHGGPYSMSSLPVFHLLPPPPKLYVPISYTARPLPNGTTVSRGAELSQGIAPFRGVAPVVGTVTGSSRRPLLEGRDTVVVELTPSFEPFPWTIDEPVDEAQRNAAADIVRTARPGELSGWIEKFRAAGIYADRRDCPDLIGQFQQALAGQVDYLLCTILDSDPLLPLNYTLSARYGDALATGVALLSRLVEVDRTLIVTEKRVELPRSLRRTARDFSQRIITIRNDYPRSDPTLLIRALTGRRLKPAHLPTQQRVLLLDAPAAVAIGLLILRGLPMLRVPFALRDHIRGKSHLMWLSPGTPVDAILSACQIPSDNITLRAGDILRDQRLTINSIIAGGELTAHLSATAPVPNPDPCIRCSWCLEGCPTRVHPAALLEAAQRNDMAMADRYGLDACIECGICSYICPSKLPLLPSIRKLKSTYAT